jgi:hypothetical protein
MALMTNDFFVGDDELSLESREMRKRIDLSIKKKFTCSCGKEKEPEFEDANWISGHHSGFPFLFYTCVRCCEVRMFHLHGLLFGSAISRGDS